MPLLLICFQHPSLFFSLIGFLHPSKEGLESIYDFMANVMLCKNYKIVLIVPKKHCSSDEILLSPQMFGEHAKGDNI